MSGGAQRAGTPLRSPLGAPSAANPRALTKPSPPGASVFRPAPVLGLIRQLRVCPRNGGRSTTSLDPTPPRTTGAAFPRRHLTPHGRISKRVTLPPTASTRPARSRPGIVRRGLRIPPASRSTYGVPVRKCQSAAFTDTASTRTNTSVSPTTGLATSRSSSQSGEPYRPLDYRFQARPPGSTVLVDPSARSRSTGPMLRSGATRGGRGARAGCCGPSSCG